MGKRKLKLKRVSLAGLPTGPTTHDRRTTDLLINARVAPAIVDDPYGMELGAKIVVLRSLRDDPLAALRNTKDRDGKAAIDEVQYDAGRRWQKYRERSDISGGVRGIDTTRERVDGGQIARSALTDEQLEASNELDRAMKWLGMEGESLMNDFLWRCMDFGQIAHARGGNTERRRRYIGDRVRECLTTLAVCFGLMTPRNPQDVVSRGFTSLPACGRRLGNLD